MGNKNDGNDDGSWSFQEFLDPKAPLLAAVGEYPYIEFFSLDTGEPASTQTLTGLGLSKRPMTAFDISYASLFRDPTLAVAGDVGDDSGNVWFLDLLSGTFLPRTVLRGHAAAVVSIADLSSGHFGDGLLATASYDKTVRVWKKRGERKMVQRARFDHISRVSLVRSVSSRGWLATLTCSHVEQALRLWDVQTRKMVPGGIICEALSCLMIDERGDDDFLFAGSTHRSIRMFPLNGSQAIRTFAPASTPCFALLLHPTNEHLFLSGHFQEVLLWDKRKEDQAVKCGFVHSGNYLSGMIGVGCGLAASFTAAKGPIKVWNVDSLIPEGGGEGRKEIVTRGRDRGLCCVTPLSKGPLSTKASDEEDERLGFLLEEPGLRVLQSVVLEDRTILVPEWVLKKATLL